VNKQTQEPQGIPESVGEVPGANRARHPSSFAKRMRSFGVTFLVLIDSHLRLFNP
jgi:hypothetical protein